MFLPFRQKLFSRLTKDEIFRHSLHDFFRRIASKSDKVIDFFDYVPVESVCKTRFSLRSSTVQADQGDCKVMLWDSVPTPCKGLSSFEPVLSNAARSII
jgi:hypothetical protein